MGRQIEVASWEQVKKARRINTFCCSKQAHKAWKELSDDDRKLVIHYVLTQQERKLREILKGEVE